MSRVQVDGKAGKYDDACGRAAAETGAALAILIVMDGHKGHGLSCVADSRKGMGGVIVGSSPKKLAELLRLYADMFDKSEGPNGLAVEPVPPKGGDA